MTARSNAANRTRIVEQHSVLPILRVQLALMLQEHATVRTLIMFRQDRFYFTIQELFERYRFHHLLVLGENDVLVGVVSGRDLLKALSPFISTLVERVQDLRTLKKPVHQIMARKPISASKDLAIEEAAALMLDKKISCLPIVRPDWTVEGIVTDQDILKWLINQIGKQF